MESLQVGQEIIVDGIPVRLLYKDPIAKWDPVLEFWRCEILFDSDSKVRTFKINPNIPHASIHGAPANTTDLDWKLKHSVAAHAAH